MTLHYGIHPSLFGDVLIAVTDRGICRLSFTLGHEEPELARIRAAWPHARLDEDPELTQPYVTAVFSAAPAMIQPPVDLHGTPFQLKVWTTLMAIPRGHVTTYGELAAAIGHPKANRAVGTAVGDNPVAVLVPCHRVIRKDGSLGGYEYGPELKSALLRWEGALR